ncbi:guanine nucleotide-binding protein subunit alpha-12 [Diaphorina citri]|uniref:Guanine nucleotide-binding protein subunit alpha-12 n=1 Tax=Diaphorina citri TaxID=121845 RepID=A0A3Q0IP34_DIACI|nr:guanine nucleotide-binding protein subunit alpha-12 [Diaphorina citri]KAI5720663.1 hypothetical protein M8J77_010108 [Diaphorina citri]
MAGCMFSCPCCLRFQYSPEEMEQRNRSQEIDKGIEKDKHAYKRQVKLLLLGAGESGKSTFLKQMKIIHGMKFESDLIIEYQQIIYQNIIKGMKVLIDARSKLLHDNKFGIPWQNDMNAIHAEKIFQFDNNTCIDSRLFSTYVDELKSLWDDVAIRQAFERRSEYQLGDSIQYFFDNWDRISRRDYIPSNKDILHARKATKGITEFTIVISNIPFLFVDVGGQRSQRRKWFQCFDSVTSILFLVSSSEYDQTLVEDRRTNRLHESRNIFDTIINNVIFRNVSFILFLNKTDLLAEKLRTSKTSIAEHFPEFEGDPQDMQAVQTFLLNYFKAVKRDEKKPLFHHFTTAVDTENIKIVFNAVKNTILHRNLRDLMLQ